MAKFTWWEKPAFWQVYGRADYYETRRQLVTSLIPPTSQSVLDVGAGRAEIVNQLPAEWRVVGIDLSRTALQYNLRGKLQARAECLPFPSEAFDVVICLEVLEHLEPLAFVQSLAELQRIARQWLVVGVPYNENLHEHDVCCPSCSLVFNSDGHLREFRSVTQVKELFSQFSLERKYLTGPQRRSLPTIELSLAQAWFQVYLPWEPYFLCPQCGFTGPAAPKPRRWIQRWVSRMLNLTRLLVAPSPYWFIGLFKRI